MKHIFRILLVGEYGSGKTSFFNRYKDNKYLPIDTIGIDFLKKEIYIHDYKLTIQFWDETHSGRYGSISPAYYRNGKGILFVVDLTDTKTIDFIINERRKNGQNELKKFVSYLVGTKKDKTIENRDEMIEYSKTNGLHYCECSSLTGENVHEIMHRITRDILEKEMLEEKEKQYLYDKQKQNKNKTNKKCIVF